MFVKFTENDGKERSGNAASKKSKDAATKLLNYVLKKQDEFEEIKQDESEKDIKERILQFFWAEDRKKRIRNWYFLILEVVGIYISGYFAQSMSQSPFSLNRYISSYFFDCLWAAITIQPLGIIWMGIINAVGIFCYQQFICKKENDLGYEISDKTTYGSANFLKQEEIDRWGGLFYFKKELEPDECGDILGVDIDTGELIIRQAKKGENRNIAVYGSPGAGKSVGIVRVTALQTIRRGESIFFNDPKGEMANSLATMYREAGYVVKFLNLVNQEASDSWNPLYGLKDDKEFVPIIADIIMTGTRKGNANGQEEVELTLLRAAIYYVLEEMEEHEHTLFNVHKLLAENSSEEITMLFNAIHTPGSYAVIEYNGYNKSSPNFSGNVITGVCSRISLFATQLKCITTQNDIDLELPGKRKCAYFVIMPDQSGAYDFIAAMFYATAINKLTKFADSQGVDENAQNIPLPIGVQFMLDEFVNTGKIPDYSKKISTIRSRGISSTIIMQGLSQMQRIYDKMEWSSILNACDLEIVLRTNEPETLKYISEKTGEASIDVLSSGTTLGGFVSSPDRETRGVGSRTLLKADEVRRLYPDEMIMIPSGMNIKKCKKYAFFQHPDKGKIKPYAHSLYHIPEWRKPYILADIKKNKERSRYRMDENGEICWKEEKKKNPETISPVNIENEEELTDGWKVLEENFSDNEGKDLSKQESDYQSDEKLSEKEGKIHCKVNGYAMDSQPMASPENVSDVVTEGVPGITGTENGAFSESVSNVSMAAGVPGISETENNTVRKKETSVIKDLENVRSNSIENYGIEHQIPKKSMPSSKEKLDMASKKDGMTEEIGKQLSLFEDCMEEMEEMEDLLL